MNKKGFTLVELSIVLVIIGLLIGGILAAQSMIGTAKIQGLVRQVGQFDAAVENFQTKYQQLPGDTNLMGATQGNNDGIICDSSSCTNSYWIGEVAKFWSDLNKSGLNNSSGTAYRDYSDNNGSWTSNFDNYTPKAVAGDKANIIVIGSPTSKKNYYLITQPWINQLLGGNNAFKPSEVLAVDTKIDDGLINSGNISGWDEADAKQSQIDDNALNGCINNGSYNIQIITDVCSIRIRIGTSIGDLK